MAALMILRVTPIGTGLIEAKKRKEPDLSLSDTSIQVKVAPRGLTCTPAPPAPGMRRTPENLNAVRGMAVIPAPAGWPGGPRTPNHLHPAIRLGRISDPPRHPLPDHRHTYHQPWRFVSGNAVPKTRSAIPVRISDHSAP